MTEAVASLQVNGLTLNWTETERRLLLACQFCQKPTRGRMHGEVGHRQEAACLICAMTTAFEQGRELQQHASKPKRAS